MGFKLILLLTLVKVTLHLHLHLYSSINGENDCIFFLTRFFSLSFNCRSFTGPHPLPSPSNAGPSSACVVNTKARIKVVAHHPITISRHFIRYPPVRSAFGCVLRGGRGRHRRGPRRPVGLRRPLHCLRTGRPSPCLSEGV